MRASASKAGLKHPPEVLTVYSFCKEFGWTIEEFYQQPKRYIEQFSVIMSAISDMRAEEQRKQEAQSRRR